MKIYIKEKDGFITEASTAKIIDARIVTCTNEQWEAIKNQYDASVNETTVTETVKGANATALETLKEKQAAEEAARQTQDEEK